MRMLLTLCLRRLPHRRCAGRQQERGRERGERRKRDVCPTLPAPVLARAVQGVALLAGHLDLPARLQSDRSAAVGKRDQVLAFEDQLAVDLELGAGAEDAGEYTVIVSNECGSVTSAMPSACAWSCQEATAC